MNGGAVLQTTLRQRVSLSGIGVHSGRSATVFLGPAAAGSGIAFRRLDLGQDSPGISAHAANVRSTDYSTTLGGEGTSIGTVEHLLAALSALEIDNVLIEVDGPEVPVMDGSASAFVAAVDRAGVVTLREPRTYLKVLRPVRVEQGRSIAELSPASRRLIDVDVEYDSPLIGQQAVSMEVSANGFREELADARTFGFHAEVEQLRAHGFAHGASLDNTLVVGEDRILNPEGPRWPDEFARHKAVDAIGDLAMAGAPVLGAFRSYRGGHGINLRLVKALLADAGAWTRVRLSDGREAEAVQAAAGSGRG
jgi:UDP-3-O-[3-hydroxymyristoyl] N-acetylglucosamine deacetylase